MAQTDRHLSTFLADQRDEYEEHYERGFFKCDLRSIPRYDHFSRSIGNMTVDFASYSLVRLVLFDVSSASRLSQIISSKSLLPTIPLILAKE